jgi:hypothetical protein
MILDYGKARAGRRTERARRTALSWLFLAAAMSGNLAAISTIKARKF